MPHYTTVSNPVPDQNTSISNISLIISIPTSICISETGSPKNIRAVFDCMKGELEMVSGGCDWGEDDDDYSNTTCHWNPDGKEHVFEEGADGIIRCKYCQVHF